MERCPTCDVDLVADLSAIPEGSASTQFVKGWAGDLDRKAAEEQRAREEWNEAEVCPACQCPVDLAASECGECGLAFVEMPHEEGA